MKKAALIFASVLAFHFANAGPHGGYIGHRIILAGEGAYSPFFTSVKDFYTKYNFQYGGNLNVIVARRTQVGVFYNMWSLGGNQAFQSNMGKNDRVNGTQYGLVVRNFRAGRGGLAPIGKFWDVSMSYASNTYKAGSDNKDILGGTPENVPVSSNQILAHVAFGTQMVFWNHFVGNTGVRFGGPIYTIDKNNGGYKNFFAQRIAYKEFFSVFFGIGFLI
ncbi:MAG TPA: hypothetical protein VFU15_11760 [Bacteroidia bacterium]|nr:hypothetical protein [Bacteroidia bacterium]